MITKNKEQREQKNTIQKSAVLVNDIDFEDVYDGIFIKLNTGAVVVALYEEGIDELNKVLMVNTESVIGLSGPELDCIENWIEKNKLKRFDLETVKNDVEDKSKRLEVAETIIDQLGYNKRQLATMTGAHNFTALKSGVQFDFKVSRKFNRCEIELTGADLYNVTFRQMSRKNASKVNREEKIEGLYCDQLTGIFEEKTGLYLSL